MHIPNCQTSHPNWLARPDPGGGVVRRAESNYKPLLQRLDNIEAILQDEDKHEAALIELLDEERLRYVGSIVLGLNDARVELTGALAGLSFMVGYVVRTVLGVEI